MTYPDTTQPDVTMRGLRAYADEIDRVWIEWSDEDLREKAQDAIDALREVARRIEEGE